jgi:hypothetical protein
MMRRTASFVLRLAATLGILFLLFRRQDLGPLEVGTLLFATIVMAASSVRFRPWAMHRPGP